MLVPRSLSLTNSLYLDTRAPAAAHTRTPRNHAKHRARTRATSVHET